MARLARTLLLATACLAGVGARAVAQPQAPATPIHPDPVVFPDPAAVLLSPVASAAAPNATPRRDLPVHPQDVDEPFAPIKPIAPLREERARPTTRPIEAEAAATLRVPEAAVRLRQEEFEAARQHNDLLQTAGQEPDEHPYDYLMGHTRRDRRELLERMESDLPRRVSEQAGHDSFGDRFQRNIEDLVNGRDGGGAGRRRDGIFRGRDLFLSDHRFDCFVSPTTNPFYAEDPRSLTELRPILLFQGVPGDQAAFRGGGLYFFGTQGRVAFTDRFSVVLNKIGLSGQSTGSGAPVPSAAGLSELWLGPKFVVIQNPDSRTLLTAGATFQLPLGAENVFQRSGKLSIVPYVSAAQELFRSEWGSFNGLATVGYTFGTNRERSDAFFLSTHLDMNLGNHNRWYPFIEANWFSYTKDGNRSPIGVELRDLGNAGAAASGSNLVTGAIGTRFRWTRNWELGAAFELPVIGGRELFRYRFTLDFILRY